MSGHPHAGVSLLDLVVPGDPVAKGRPRHGQGRTYTPTATARAEQAIGLLARHQLRSTPPTREHVHVEVDFHVRTRRRCDLDNLLKLALDALTGIVWRDDDQVVSLTTTKQHTPDAPKTIIRVHLEATP